MLARRRLTHNILSLEIVLLKICFVARIVSELETEKSGMEAKGGSEFVKQNSIQWKAGHAITKNSPKRLSALLNQRHASALSIFWVRPCLQWDIWAGHERRVAFWLSKIIKIQHSSEKKTIL